MLTLRMLKQTKFGYNLGALDTYPNVGGWGSSNISSLAKFSFVKYIHKKSKYWFHTSQWYLSCPMTRFLW